MPTIRLGRKIRVPKAALHRMLDSTMAGMPSQKITDREVGGALTDGCRSAHRA